LNGIGETIQHVDVDIPEKYPYQWHLPRSFRSYAAHEYFGINLSQINKQSESYYPISKR